VVKGKPEEVFPDLFKRWKISLLTFESDTEPYAIRRDKAIGELCARSGVKVSTQCSHTLHNTNRYIAEGIPKSYQGFVALFAKIGPPRRPIPAPSRSQVPAYLDSSTDYDVPTLEDMGYPPLAKPLTFPGGETEALRRLEATVSSRPDWVTTFEKPNTGTLQTCAYSFTKTGLFYFI
jgi:cryptochrome